MKAFKTLCLILLLSPGSFIRAQEAHQSTAGSQPAMLSGHIYDRNGAVIAGATVRFLSSKKITVEVQTDEEGIYRVHLQPGFYDIEITERGFYKLELACYQVPAHTPQLSLDVTLTVGGEGNCLLLGLEKTDRKVKDTKKLIIIE